ncbi:MAG: LysM peptidoglycan-binding domain-containing protein, partial [Deltaproteobacteria bacterium]|nr:LysM peptidoglycan-binding domain-containing protein [Deltaproteobacteria bacterium]
MKKHWLFSPVTMLITQIRLASLTAAILFYLFISGCSVTQDFVKVSPPQSPETIVPESEQDPDLSPLEIESEICLDQELEALKHTGSWDEPYPDSIQQTLITEFAEPEVVYDFPITINRQVELYLKLFQGKQRRYFGRWLARSGRYLPMMEAELKTAGLPLDLAYLSMIESGFNQRAYSRARAVGLWQFMYGTGRDYGLKVNKYVDERRDAEKSTKAAVTYLKNLYDEFGDWYLAVAAYNGGPGTIRSAIRRSKSNDFWKIAQKKYLRLETKRYVPKLIAAIIIAKEPEKYGFTDLKYEKPLAYDTVTVGPGLSLEAAAILADSKSKVIKSLNQELRTSKTPLNVAHYELKIPSGSKHLAENNLPRLHSVVNTQFKTHIIRSGENLTQICRRYNINTTTLLKVNNLQNGKLVVGHRLRIPFRTVQYRILPEGMDAAIAAKNDLILHTIKKGETISKISQQYQIPPELIVAWNGLPSVHKITAGQQLALYMSNNATSPVRTTAQAAPPAPKQKSIVVLSDNLKRAPSSEQVSEAYRWYRVKNGDSLWTISRRFNTSPAHIKKWNNLKSNLIHP